MPSRPDKSMYDSLTDTQLDLNPREKTGFVENWGAALGVAVDEELSVSSIINSPNFTDRNKQLFGMVKEGKIPNADAFLIGDSYSYKQYDWNALSRHAKKLGIDVKTDSEMLSDKTDELAARRKYAEDIMSRANLSGVVGKFAGYMNAGALDPVNVGASLFAPAALAKYLGNVASVRRVMIAEGIGGAASEAAIAPFVHDWKETIGVDYTLEDALVNMAAAGLLNAGIGGLAAKLGAVIKEGKSQGIDVTPIEISKQELDRVKDEMKDISPEDYYRNVEEAKKQIELQNKLPPPIDDSGNVVYVGPDGQPKPPPTRGGKPGKQSRSKDKDKDSPIEDVEIYVSTENGLVKSTSAEVQKALDNRIKDIDEEMGVPICNG